MPSEQFDRDTMRHMLHNAGKRPKVFTSEELEDARVKMMKDFTDFIKRSRTRGEKETALDAATETVIMMQMRGTIDQFFAILGLEDFTSYYE